LAIAVEMRFLELCEAYLRIKGERLKIPDSLLPDARRWRAMLVRHRRGDLRCTPSELKATKAFADWTVKVNCEMRNQPAKKVEWEG
jgi:hypothetical protein